MALDKTGLQTTIKALMLDMKTKESASFDEFAQRLADAIDVYVKTGTVTVAPGIPVSTAGSPTAQTGATTAPGTGTIT
jgi:hypothetical protein